ncbi:glutathione S-transferase [Aspergillus insuetus]
MIKRPSPAIETVLKEGAFVRPPTQFRSFISSEPGAVFPAEPGRYHLYVSYACPWAHRTLIIRKLKGLEDIIGATAVHPHLDLDKGWRFPTADEKLEGELCGPDPLHDDVQELRDLYLKANPNYTGRYSVPVLWDTKVETIVNNESAEIVHMFNSTFDSLIDEEYRRVNLVLPPLKSSIDEMIPWIYDEINNGVYKAGVARTQEAYESAVKTLFSALDRIEKSLSIGPYYFGDPISVVDIFLYVTLIRFDVVYVTLFKCNIRDIRIGYPAIHRWLRKLYWDVPAFKETTIFQQIKEHYFKSLTMINPTGIVPEGPQPHILEK